MYSSLKFLATGKTSYRQTLEKGKDVKRNKGKIRKIRRECNAESQIT
jgi:hypothetical protein